MKSLLGLDMMAHTSALRPELLPVSWTGGYPGNTLKAKCARSWPGLFARRNVETVVQTWRNTTMAHLCRIVGVCLTRAQGASAGPLRHRPAHR